MLVGRQEESGTLTISESLSRRVGGTHLVGKEVQPRGGELRPDRRSAVGYIVAVEWSGKVRGQILRFFEQFS